MHTSSGTENLKRRPVNLTIREDILRDAKDLNLNASKAAELGISNAVREAQAQRWLEDNKQALMAHNQRVEESGTLLTPAWVE